MKLVLNKNYGGFSLPREYCYLCERNPYDYDDADRCDPLLITIVEMGCEKPDLKVVEIPDEATDYEINEYDGFESVIYVVDGKLHHE